MFIGGLKRITLKNGVMYLINNNLVGEFINSTPKGFNFKKTNGKFLFKKTYLPNKK